ncbi:response regulator transcription factor [Anaerocolumna jejuensis]|uniref:response regulator transcription factor n=1 Tax=Anaerocolumna jejuensis TaxID=259063 RepID=UPI003F7BA693
MIKVLIADDQELIRHSLQIILGNQKDMEVTGSAENGIQVIREVRANKPDIILMDIRMPEMDGVKCTKIIKENYPEIKIIILTTFDDDEYIFSALRDGASGYLLKGIHMDELVDAIHKVNSGSAMINPDIATKVVQLFSRIAKSNITVQVSREGVDSIVNNEWKVIKKISCGLSNKEIAAELSLSEGTVRNYISSILNKLNLRDRTQLAIWAVQERGQNGEA